MPVQSGRHDGSSWRRNWAHRSSSSCSPMAPAPTQTVEAPEEAPVGRMGPAHQPRPLPAGRPQSVETAVVAHPEAGVGLHVVPGQRAEGRPGRRASGGGADHVGHGVAATLARLGQAASSADTSGRGSLGQDRLGQAGGQADRRHCDRSDTGARSWRSV